MAWLQLSVEVTGDQADLVTQVFSAAGALSVTLQDAADEPLLEPAPGELPVWSHTRVVALFPPDCDPERVRDGLRVALADAMLALQVERIEDRDWSSTWREDFHCMRFGSRTSGCVPPVNGRPMPTPFCWRWIRGWPSGPVPTPRPRCVWNGWMPIHRQAGM